jgi:hypothetical protein
MLDQEKAKAVQAWADNLHKVTVEVPVNDGIRHARSFSYPVLLQTPDGTVLGAFVPLRVFESEPHKLPFVISREYMSPTKE